MPSKRKPVEERFWSKVEKTDNCWNWIGAKSKFGHGNITLGGKNGKHIVSSRLSYIIHYGDIKDDKLYVCHKCDNPSCVRPDHLFLGTQKDNLQDCILKKRWKTYDKSGANNPNYGKHWNNEFKDKMSNLYSKEYEITDHEGKIIRFKNLKKFCKDNDLNVGHCSQLRRRLVKSCKGFTNLIKLEPA